MTHHDTNEARMPQAIVDAYPVKWLAAAITRIREHPEMAQHHLLRLAAKVEAQAEEIRLLKDASLRQMEQWQDLQTDLFVKHRDLNAALSQIEALTAERDALRADAERCQWLRDRFVGADFDWSESGQSVLVFKVEAGAQVWGDFNLTIDAARAITATEKEQG